MKEIENNKKRCPKCLGILKEFLESGNDGGNRNRLIRYYCESCKITYDEKDVISTITEEILLVKTKKNIKGKMANSRISDNEARSIAIEIANDFF